MSATDPVAVDHAFNTLGTMNTRDVFRAVKRDMMDRRDVDSDTVIGRPVSGLGAGGAQHP